MEQDRLREALTLLGEITEDRGVSADLYVIGGGALLLRGVVSRPTADVDVMARRERDRWVPAEPLPSELAVAIRDVGRALGLDLQSGDRDWLNGAPSALLTLCPLPDGWLDRAERHAFGGVVLHVAAPEDLVLLKLWAAASSERSRRAVDLDDLRALKPSRELLLSAARRCAAWDGRPDAFQLEMVPLLKALGFQDEP